MGKAASGHFIDITRGAGRRNPPEGAKLVREFQPFRDAVRSCGIKPTKRRRNIMSMLATGWLPWGRRWDEQDGFANLPLHGRQYLMCCGHVMNAKEAQAFVDAGLLMAGPPDRFERPTLVITEAGREWLSLNW